VSKVKRSLSILFSVILLAFACGLLRADTSVTPSTFAAALKAAMPGDVLVLADGAYAPLKATGPSGTPESPITLRAATPGKAVITGTGTGRGWDLNKANYWTLEGLCFTNNTIGLYFGLSKGVTVRRCLFLSNGTGMMTGGSSDVLVENCEALNSTTEHHIYFGTTDRAVVRNCTLGRARKSAVQWNGEGRTNPIAGGLVENCRIWGCGTTYAAQTASSSAINTLKASGITIRDCSIWGNFGSGIAVDYKSSGVTIEGCFIGFHPRTGGRCITGGSPVGAGHVARGCTFLMGSTKAPCDNPGFTLDQNAEVKFAPVVTPVPTETGVGQ
jgi:hypothetical protein